MTENTKSPYLKFFWLELALVLVIPFIICWANIPTSILNSGFLFKVLEIIGICGGILRFFAGIPVGIVGIIKARRMVRLRYATIALSIINLIAGIIELLMVVLILCAVVFGGVTH